MLSYILADNEHCKQVLLAQESQKSQDANGIQNQNGLLLSIVSGICAMGTHLAGASNGRARNLKFTGRMLLCFVPQQQEQTGMH